MEHLLTTYIPTIVMGSMESTVLLCRDIHYSSPSDYIMVKMDILSYNFHAYPMDSNIIKHHSEYYFKLHI